MLLALLVLFCIVFWYGWQPLHIQYKCKSQAGYTVYTSGQLCLEWIPCLIQQQLEWDSHSVNRSLPSDRLQLEEHPLFTLQRPDSQQHACVISAWCHLSPHLLQIYRTVSAALQSERCYGLRPSVADRIVSKRIFFTGSWGAINSDTYFEWWW